MANSGVPNSAESEMMELNVISSAEQESKPDLLNDVVERARTDDEAGKDMDGDLGTTSDTSEDGLEKPKRSGPWTRIKKRWNRKGVVEVDIDHHRYDMLNCIREGIRDVVLNHLELGPKDELKPEDYEHILEKTVESPSGQTFQFASYASPVFATLRRAIGLTEREFAESMAPEWLPYLEFVSNSKSGQDFFLTEYLEHFQKFPHSLIVKYLGLYSIKVPGAAEMYFYAMQSIFYPEERIEVRYDIKGCMAGRHQRPPDAGKTVITVLKDQNFVSPEEQFIALGTGQKEWFIKQLEHDVAFLKQLGTDLMLSLSPGNQWLCLIGVQDYSLLVGSHALLPDEKKENFADVVIRVQKSVATPTKKQETADDSPRSDSSRPESSTSAKSAVSMKAAAKFKQKIVPRPFSLVDRDYLDELGAQNRRLLPIGKNPLHVFNGPERRQRTGRVLKSIKFCCGDHSTIPPQAYGDRFLRFIREHVC